MQLGLIFPSFRVS